MSENKRLSKVLCYNVNVYTKLCIFTFMMAHMSSSYGSVWLVGPGITFCALFRALYSQITNTGLEIKRIFFWLVWRCFWSDWSFACLQNFYYRQHHFHLLLLQ